jgi:hypothetical protein
MPDTPGLAGQILFWFSRPLGKRQVIPMLISRENQAEIPEYSLDFLVPVFRLGHPGEVHTFLEGISSTASQGDHMPY